MRIRIQWFILVAAGAGLVAFLSVPLLALVITSSPQRFTAGLIDPSVWPALKLSIMTTVSSLAVVVVLGTPLAWSLANANGTIVRSIETAIEMPIVVPPAVAGVALLLAFGRHGVLARLLPGHSLSITFTTTAVVMAELFVSAPFFLQAAVSAFRAIDTHLLVVARTFGASPLRVFFRIALPLAAPGLIAGALMSWARSLGEFGATLMFAGNLQGETQTLPLAIYAALESDLGVAQALSIILVFAAFVILLVARVALRKAIGARGHSV